MINYRDDPTSHVSAVYANQTRIGTIDHHNISRWLWIVHGGHGIADSEAEARLDLETAFHAWLDGVQ